MRLTISIDYEIKLSEIDAPPHLDQLAIIYFRMTFQLADGRLDCCGCRSIGLGHVNLRRAEEDNETYGPMLHGFYYVAKFDLAGQNQLAL